MACNKEQLMEMRGHVVKSIVSLLAPFEYDPSGQGSKSQSLESTNALPGTFLWGRGGGREGGPEVGEPLSRASPLRKEGDHQSQERRGWRVHVVDFQP